jgi:hypothetical protein
MFIGGNDKKPICILRNFNKAQDQVIFIDNKSNWKDFKFVNKLS